MSDDQLMLEIQIARKLLFDLRVHGSTEPRSQASAARRQRKEIARLLTIQRERRNVTPAPEFVRGNESSVTSGERERKLLSVRADCEAKAASLGLNFGQDKNQPMNCDLKVIIWGYWAPSVHEAGFRKLIFPNQNAATICCEPTSEKTNILAYELKRSGIANGVWT